MAMHSNESLMTSCSPPRSSSSHHVSPGHHFYVAVDRTQFKMDTLVDLLGVVCRRSLLPVILCCSSRDELDAVCSTVSNLSFISWSPLYSDQPEIERASIFEQFRQATTDWNRNISSQSEEIQEAGNAEKKSCLIVVTDACVPTVLPGEPPVLARLLINYELPTKKETYMRRMSTCLAPDGIVINMVVGGEVVALKALEESSGIIIAEMPINISEIL